ncbi:MAG TPA: glycosyltransferase family 9 protein [Pirellulales bacterium]
MPRINVEFDQYYGIGDLTCLAWIAEATSGATDPITFRAPRGMKYTVLELLGQEVTDNPQSGGICVYQAYQNELQDRGRKRRVDYICDLLGIPATVRRPKVHLPPDDVEWATATKQDLGGDDLVLLFPQTHWTPREWPACYWVDLAWGLNERNVRTAVFLGREDSRFANTPRSFWGFPLTKVAALMAVSAMVIGEDSGPAHLAATIGTPTVVLSGPTRPECVFGHVPEVTALSSDEEPNCSGCHFASPFRSACDQGCQMLYSLKPHTVLGRIISELSLIKRRAKPRDR